MCSSDLCGVLLEIITSLSQKYFSDNAELPPALLRLGEIISKIETEFAEDWSLKRIYRLAATSSNTLLRLFQSADRQRVV